MNVDASQAPDANYYDEAYRAIAASLTRAQLGLLIGAGMSTESTVPAGDALARRMMRRAVLGEDQEDNVDHCALDALAASYPFEAILQLLASRLQYHDLSRWLLAKAPLENAQPAGAHLKLRELYDLQPHQFPRTLFTTNFDSLIEKAFNRDRDPANPLARCLTSANISDLPDAREKRQVVVCHLHGCVEYSDSIVAGEQVQATLEGPIYDLLRAALATDIFVLVGYSMRDTDLRRVFFDIQRIAKTRSGLKKRTFAVSPAEGGPRNARSEWTIARDIWEQRHIEHIAAGAGDFFSTLFDTVDNVVLARMGRQVASALGKDERTLQSMLETATDPFGVICADDLLLYLHYALTPFEDTQ